MITTSNVVENRGVKLRRQLERLKSLGHEPAPRYRFDGFDPSRQTVCIDR